MDEPSTGRYSGTFSPVGIPRATVMTNEEFKTMEEMIEEDDKLEQMSLHLHVVDHRQQEEDDLERDIEHQ